MIRRTGEQQVYEADERAQAKTLYKTARATCQFRQVYTQGIGLDGPDSKSIPSSSPRAFLWEKSYSAHLNRAIGLLRP